MELAEIKAAVMKQVEDYGDAVWRADRTVGEEEDARCTRDMEAAEAEIIKLIDLVAQKVWVNPFFRVPGPSTMTNLGFLLAKEASLESQECINPKPKT